jgi:hypothetical protein
MGKLAKQLVLGAGLAGVLGALTVAASSHALSVQICPKSGQGGPNPVIATKDQGAADCWTGPSWEAGVTWSRGEVTTTSGSGRSVGSYAFYGLEHNPPPWGGDYGPYAQSLAYSSSNVYLCAAYDSTGNGSWAYNTSSACNNAAYVIVSARENIIN